MDELERKTTQHFTCAELVEFLGIEVEDIFDRFPGVIQRRYKELAEEICFEFEQDLGE